MFEKFEVPNYLLPSDPRFGCGPSVIPMETVHKLAQSGVSLLGTSHRQRGVKGLVKSIQEGLQEYFKLPEDYEVILGNGGATLLWDMMATGMAEGKTFHYVNGEFSGKWHKAHLNAPWLDVQGEFVEYGQGFEVKKQKDCDMICCTLNETSTGAMTSSIPKKRDRGSLLAIDATSGAGQIPLDMNAIDFYYFSSQKVFASEGGLFIGFMSPEAIERVLTIEAARKRYIPAIMNWKTTLDNSRKNQTYNTPSVSTLFFLNEQIRIMNKVGEREVSRQAEEKASHIYGWAESKEYLSPFIKEDKYRSRSVATIDLHERFSAKDLAGRLRELGAVVDIEAYRKLGRNQLRISLFYNVSLENLQKLTEIISLAIESEPL